MSKSIITYDYLTELNQNGVLFDCDLFLQQINNDKLIQKGIVDKINSQLEFSIDFEKPDELAFSLYKNNIYPREITFNYFKDNRHENPIYELPYEGAKEMLLVENIEDRESLAELFNAMVDELPAPKKRGTK